MSNISVINQSHMLFTLDRLSVTALLEWRPGTTADFYCNVLKFRENIFSKMKQLISLLSCWGRKWYCLYFMNNKLVWSNLILFLDTLKMYLVLKLYFCPVLKICSHKAFLSAQCCFCSNPCYPAFYYLYGILIHSGFYRFNSLGEQKNSIV